MTTALRWYRSKTCWDEPLIHVSVDGPARPGEVILLDDRPFMVLSAGVCRDLRSGDHGSYTLCVREASKDELDP